MFPKLFNKKDKVISKIGILYICTGKYHIFWDGFYKSADKFFCKNSEVHYFVFTEHPINTYGNDFVHHIYQEKLGWPFDTLKRFHLFLEQKYLLEKMDYLFFFNANMEIKEEITEKEILPRYKKSGLVSVLHSGFYKHRLIPPFEDNKNSAAYVKADSKLNYYQGCLSGGNTTAYLKMAEAIKTMVDADLQKSIIGKWWDESYMNKYFISHPPKALSPSYAYPQDQNVPVPVKILMYEKGNFGGHDFLRA